MKSRTWKSVVTGLLALLAGGWLVLTLVALVGSITGGNPLYTAVPGGLTLPSLSLFGKLYLGTSALMPFVAVAALSLA